jgi:FtsZ-binding cell division protein ZapB
VFSLFDFSLNWWFPECLILFHFDLLAERSQNQGSNGSMTQFEFRSPLRKLVAFLKGSRDKWKEKCQQAKYELKLLKRRFDNLRISRDQWQQRCRQTETQREQLQARGEHLQAQHQQLQVQLEAFLKKGSIRS